MKITYYLTRPVSLEILTVLVIGISILIIRHHNLTQIPVLAVLREQQAVAKRCAPNDRLYLVPYAKWISEIDATACPQDFLHAWEKYVCDVRALSALDRVEAGKSMMSIAAAVVAENPESLLDAIPRQAEQLEMARNAAAVDWQNVKYVALRYGIKLNRIQYS